MEMKGYVVYEKGGPFVKETIQLAEPEENEVLVRLTATGICHTDLKYRDIIGAVPILYGHEGSGIVEKIGPGVDKVKVGDRVVVCWDYCGKCEACKVVEVQDCASFHLYNGLRKKTLGGNSKLTNQKGEEINCFLQGTFATHSVVRQNALLVIEQDVPLEMLAAMACGVQTGVGTVWNILKPSYTDTLVITGVGSVGLSALLGAKLVNCGKIVAIDYNDRKLAMAQELGATHIINSKGVDDLSSAVQNAVGSSANFVIDTTGEPDIITEGIKMLGLNGVIAALAIGPPVPISPIGQLNKNKKTLLSANMGAADPHKIIPMMIQRYQEGRFPIDKIMNYYSFDEMDKACEEFHDGLSIKPILRMS